MKRKQGIYEKYMKRLFDILLSLFAIICLSPMMLVTAILVRIRLGSPVIFCQERPGKIDEKTGKEKIFKMYKFRSMTDARDENGELLPDEVRLTDFGRKLRSTSLDELPELFNILKGDMSIVGPRPLVPRYLPYYTDIERHRHDVRPGLTGLAQVNGRNFIGWEEIFSYDLHYIEKVTFSRDISIVMKTIGKVFKHENIEDVSKAIKDEQGRFHCFINGNDYILHQPLDIERENL